MVITTTIFNFDVFRILIDDIRSYDLIYVEFFEKLGPKKEKMWPYEGSNLQAFNDIITRP